MHLDNKLVDKNDIEDDENKVDININKFNMDDDDDDFANNVHVDDNSADDGKKSEKHWGPTTE